MLQAIKSWFVAEPPTCEHPVRNIHPLHYDTVLICHGNCPDGTASAWLLLRKYPNAYVHFASERDFDNDKRMPQLSGREVILADWCYPLAILERIIKIASKLVIYDHHATAHKWCEAVSDRADVHFDTSKCGAELCADAVNYHPWWLEHIRDRDLWLWKHPQSKAFSAAFFEDGVRIGTLDVYEESDPETVYARGNATIAHEQWALSRVSKTAQECTIDGHNAIIVQSPTWGSELGNALLQNSDHPIAIIISWDFLNAKWRVSLRSRNSSHAHINVAQLCEKYNGGGHPQAAGFTTATLHMINIKPRM